MTVTDKQLRTGIGAGFLAIISWFAVTRTTLVFAYGTASSKHTLSQAQGLCDSALGQIGRSMSATAATNCASVDSYAMWANVVGFAGLVLLAWSAGWLWYRAQHREPRMSARVGG